jgi:hypothetical protein
VTAYDAGSVGLTADQKRAALLAVMAEWGRTDADYDTRVRHLSGSLNGGLNGAYQLNAATVIDDGAADTLFGDSTALDWFFGSLSNQDVVMNWKSPEAITLV